MIQSRDNTHSAATPEKLRLNRLTLEFNGDLAHFEQPFRDAYFDDSLKQLRFALILGAFFYGIFGALDAFLIPELKYRFWAIRFAIVIPVLLTIVGLSYTRHFKSYMQPALSLLMIISGSGIIAMIAMAPPPVNHSYYTGLILIFIFAYSFVRARFIWATPAGWIVVILYEAVVLFGGRMPLSVQVNNNFFFISANVLGMLVCYATEYNIRKNYFLSRLVEAEQEKVKSLNQGLEQTVRERTAQLTRINLELQQEIDSHHQLDLEKQRLEHQLRQSQKMEAIGTLAGGIAHDFNNILAAIMGHAELANLQIEAHEKVRNNLSEILKASERAKDLIAQILSFSRQGENQVKPIEIGPIVKEVLKLIRATLPASIDIRDTIQPNAGIVLADTTQIHQILMNLCTNAAHAMQPRGGILTIALSCLAVSAEMSAASPEIPSQLVPGSYLRLTVADTGHGIQPDQLERIFEPYFTTKEKDVGTGMGLAVVHGIVQAHDGAVQVNSTQGKGTAFHVYLPCIESAVKPVLETIHAYTGGNERVLYIDDEKVLVEMARQLLERLGYRVTTQTRAIRALEIFRANPEAFDIVITDMTMPHITGDKLAEEIKAIRHDIPIIMCTGFSDLLTPERLNSLGLEGFLHKPITLANLSATIRNALDKKNSNRFKTRQSRPNVTQG